jgi:hypothetical protein
MITLDLTSEQKGSTMIDGSSLMHSSTLIASTFALAAGWS